SPRRLGVLIPNVSAQAPDRTDAIKLMPVSVGLDANGNATPALLKRLNALGADESAIPQLRKAMDGKAEALFFDQTIQGASLATSLQLALEETLENLPIPKVMSYQLVDGWTSVNFVRPAHGLVALHGADIVPIHLLGIAASDLTQGHRFEAVKHPVMIKEADSYEKQMLEEGAVIASFEKRRAEIARQLAAAAAKEGLTPIEDDALLDEVTALVERPNVLVGQFEESFLEVPQECLILTMQANQKYFAITDQNGKMKNRFLLVSNLLTPTPELITTGNERVLRARLADAKFFFDQDRKKTLESRLPGLANVVYHNKLGTQKDRNGRLVELAAALAPVCGADVEQAKRAALLCKADLL
ncbi:MAG TPA: glycine--tRNA ligase subunit beta, partial [Methylophilaceae bacterium]|nr:glycine--tRNA ligase subunit beta [Methylophilaceae bacterium]